MINRRHLFIGAATAATAAAIFKSGAAKAAEEPDLKPDTSKIPDYDKWQLSDKEWKDKLAGKGEAYAVLRREATERPFTSALNAEHRKGVFSCAGCGYDLFTTEMKFDSGTGWPSFFNHLPDALATKTDFKLVIPRTEYHCARCGGHQGHVFNDGPSPTGLRYCNNGVALTFRATQG